MSFSALRRTRSSRAQQRCRDRFGRYRPHLEFLESRLAPATLTVTTTADDLTPNDGSVSLREAITAVNAGNDLGDPDISAQNPGTFGTNDTIRFNIPGTGVPTILVGSTGLGRLPAVSVPVDIDGHTQGVFSGAAIELDGAGAGANAPGLELRGGNSFVGDLAINRFSGDGIWLNTHGGDRISGCFIGTNAKGTLVLSNFGNGVFIDNIPNNSVMTDLIGGSGNNGVLIQGPGAAGNSVSGNHIGTNLAGTTSLANNLDGVLIDSAPNNTVGSNTIAANGANGVHILGIASAGNAFASNSIGLAGLGNSTNGVFVEGAPSSLGTGNVIIANGNDGILIQGAGASDTAVMGNFIGTDASTSRNVGNLQDGIHIDNAPSSVIGGPGGGTNTIAGNSGDGVFIGGTGATGTQLIENDIGVPVMPGGPPPLGNKGNGITISGASGTTIDSGAILANGDNGVLIVGATATNNILESGVGITANKNDGVRIDSAPNNSILGGSVIQLSEGNGIHIMGTGANGNIIQGAMGISQNSLYGIVLEGTQVQNNLIGGTNVGDGNNIRGNVLGGVAIFGDQNTGNAILGNDIGDQQGSLGIDLVTGSTYPANDNFTRPNTPGGPHVGPNNLQNYPILLSATPVPPGPGQITGGERIHGSLNSTPNTTFRLEFFWHHLGTRTFLGFANVTTNSQGNVTFTINTTSSDPMGPPSAPAGDPVTATATDPGGNTSEFAREILAGFGVVIAGRNPQTGQWLVAKSTGSSFTSTYWTTWDPTVNWVDVRTGDFNGAGRTDIAGRDSGTGQWWVAISDGSSFTNQMWAVWSTGVTWVDVVTGDFNGDGKIDIAGRAKESGQWWVSLSNGSGFDSHLWTTWSTGATWVDVKAGQFTADPRTSIAGRALEFGAWWVAQSTGSSFADKLWTVWSTFVKWLDVQVGDFNGDGLADIAGRADFNGQWWLALSDGSKFNDQLWATWSTGVTWADVVVGNFNGDGTADIAGRYKETGQWWVSLSNGSAFVTKLWTTWVPSVNWLDIRAGDFNDDGQTDIAGRQGDNGQWWVAASNGISFTNLPWGPWSTAINWADVSTGRF
jgi:CSLREA domain-containing protein